MSLTLEGSNFSWGTSQKSSKSFSQRSRKSQGSSPQHLEGLYDQPRVKAQDGSFVPMVLDLLKIKDFPVPPHDIAEVAQKLDNLLRRRVNIPDKERDNRNRGP